METPGHTIYGGSGLPIGRCLEDPVVHAKLRQYLAEAEKLCTDDPVVKERVARDKTFFSQLWEKNAAEYAKLKKNEVIVPRTSGGIKIDGKLDEPDWKKAPFTSGFVLQNQPGKLALNQSFCKILTDGKNLYFGLVGDEVDTNNIKNEVTKHDGPVWRDNSFEIYLADGKGGCFHYVINNIGTVYDAGPGGNIAFDGGIEAKTVVGTRNVVTEIRIPLEPTGIQFSPGSLFPVNVTRIRRLKDKNLSESSSWSNGAWGESAAFRKVSTGGNIIPNGTFSDLVDANRKNKTIRSEKWVLKWDAAGHEVRLETAQDKTSFIVMDQATIYRFLNLPENKSGKLAGEVKISGKGMFSIRLSTCIRTVNDRRGFAHEKKRVILEGTLSPEPKIFRFENIPFEAGEQGYIYIEVKGNAKLYSICAAEQ